MDNTLAEKEQEVEGFLIAFELSCEYGGPEEGGWYYDSGTAVAMIPCTRLCKVTYNEENSEPEFTVKSDTQSCEVLRSQSYIESMLSKRGFCKSSEYTSVRPNHKSYCWIWSPVAKYHFPDKIPHYE